MAAELPSSFVLIYSSNLDGDLEPCGCSEFGNQGGLKRRAQVIADLREDNKDLFLVSGGGLLASHTAHDKLISEYILKGFEILNYDAVAVQPNDLAYGVDFSLQKEKFPWVLSNSGGEYFPRERLLERGGNKLAVLSWFNVESLPPTAQLQDVLSLNKSLVTFNARLKDIKKQGYITFVATTMPWSAVQNKLPLENIDIILVKSSYEEYGEALFENGTLVLQAGSRGMRLGRLDLTINKAGIVSYKHQVLPMPPSVPDAESMQAWYDAYNADVKAAYLKSVALRKARRSGDVAYAGVKACKQCHAKEYKTWRDSRHAKAYSSLSHVNKAFDPSCIGCHTVGFEKEGGFIDSDVTSHLKHVQCEACHGVGQAHATSGGQAKTGHHDWPQKKICAQCHVPKHSPEFDYKKYWPNIIH